MPVINALTDDFHPCQVLADCQTLIEHKGELDGLKIAFVGDGNNMVHSWLEAAAIVPFSFALACPKGYEPDGEILKRARKRRREDHGDPLRRRSRFAAPMRFIRMFGPAWARREETQTRFNAFRDYQVNSRSRGDGQERCGGHALFAGASRRGNHP